MTRRQRLCLVLSVVCWAATYLWFAAGHREDGMRQHDLAYRICADRLSLVEHGKLCSDEATAAAAPWFDHAVSTAAIEALFVLACLWAICLLVYGVSRWIVAGRAS